MGLILLIILLALIIAVLPTWPYSMGWGYRPFGLLSFLLLILLVLLLLNVIKFANVEMHDDTLQVGQIEETYQ